MRIPQEPADFLHHTKIKERNLKTFFLNFFTWSSGRSRGGRCWRAGAARAGTWVLGKWKFVKILKFPLQSFKIKNESIKIQQNLCQNYNPKPLFRHHHFVMFN